MARIAIVLILGILVSSCSFATNGVVPETMVTSTFSSAVAGETAPVEIGVSTRLEPVPFGKTARTLDGLEITVVEVNSDAWPEIQELDASSELQDPGNRAIMLTLQVQNIDAGPGIAEIGNSNFVLVGSENVLYYHTIDPQASCGIVPQELEIELPIGETTEGNLCWQVPESETDFTLSYQVEIEENVTISDAYFEIPLEAID